MRRTTKIIKPISAAVVVILILTSCQKEVTGDVASSVQNPPGNSGKVKTYTEDVRLATNSHFSETYNLTYDNNDRLLTLVSATSPGNKSVYQYNSDNTYTMDLYRGNAVSLHEVFILNNLPYVDSTIQYNAADKDTTTEKYVYNLNKQLTTLREYHYTKATGSTLLNTTDYTYDNNGNVIKETQSALVTTYEYYPDVINNLSTGLTYFHHSKNLVKTTTSTAGPMTSQVINHTYTFDNEKRITSEKQTYSNGDLAILSFSY